EEREVLKSIFDESELKFTDEYTLEYRLGEVGNLKSLVLKVTWPEGYPDIPPIIYIYIDSFYNTAQFLVFGKEKRILAKIMNLLANEQLGTALTFSLIDQLKENSEEYFRLIDLDHSESKHSENVEASAKLDEVNMKKAARRSLLTKAQKRRQLNRLDQNGVLPRGWNWVSVVKHLQQHPSDPTV
ncbi:RWD domain-containing protein 4, partial [Fasciolopsis buskii]